MSGSGNASGIPENYVQLKGSELRPSPSARVIGPADPQERISVTIVLRRKAGAEPIPNFEHFRKTPPASRRRLSQQEFADKYGASDEDLRKVADFARGAGLSVDEMNAARRTVVVTGTAEQLSRAFGVTLQRYEHQVRHRRGTQPVTETYRGLDGFIHIPKDLEGIIIGVLASIIGGSASARRQIPRIPCR